MSAEEIRTRLSALPIGKRWQALDAYSLKALASAASGNGYYVNHLARAQRVDGRPYPAEGAPLGRLR